MIAVSTVLIFVLLCLEGIMVAIITMSSMTNEMPLQLQKLRNNKSLVTSNITIGGNSQFVTNSTNGQIAGVLNRPTIVNLTPVHLR